MSSQFNENGIEWEENLFEIVKRSNVNIDQLRNKPEKEKETHIHTKTASVRRELKLTKLMEEL